MEWVFQLVRGEQHNVSIVSTRLWSASLLALVARFTDATSWRRTEAGRVDDIPGFRPTTPAGRYGTFRFIYARDEMVRSAAEGTPTMEDQRDNENTASQSEYNTISTKIGCDRTYTARKISVRLVFGSDRGKPLQLGAIICNSRVTRKCHLHQPLMCLMDVGPTITVYKHLHVSPSRNLLTGYRINILAWADGWIAGIQNFAVVLQQTLNYRKGLTRGRTDQFVTYLEVPIQVCFSVDRALVSPHNSSLT